MKRWLPYPLLWLSLLAMWLVLNETLDPATAIIGAFVALGATWSYRSLQPPQTQLRSARAALELAWLVLEDMVRSNIAVARIVCNAGNHGHTSNFVRIPLQLRHPVGLAALACIITACPGTAWARYDSTSGVLTMHILDLVDEETWIRTVKQRYERLLLEIFQ